jgi:hypothetical protein
MPRTPPLLAPLETGDHLTREEFERRYDAMPHLKKAELIEGVVYMPSPVRVRARGSPHADFMTWLGTYRARTPGVLVADNSSVRLDLESMPQPDGLMLVEPGFGGRAKIDADDFVVGGQELVAEIAASSSSIDLNAKKRVFHRNDVQEYVVWRVLEKAVDWFVQRQGDYDRLPLDSDGIYRSLVFPGLWLDAAALTRLDLARVLQVVQQGIASEEHEAFVERLRLAERQKGAQEA